MPDSPPPRVGFVTCVELGLSCLREIVAAGGTLDCVVTLHDHIGVRKSGRVRLDDFCAEHGIPLFKIRHVNDADAVALLRARELDWLFIIGWSQIASADVLTAPRLGALGMHPTLLPEGRGRASIPWAILKGLDETGVTMFKLDEGVDTGPVLAQERIPVGAREVATTLYEKVARAHRSLMRRAWPKLVRGELALTAQDESRATYWPGRTHEDGRLDPAMTVAEADALVRATTRPYPGAFLDRAGGRLRVWAATPRDDASGALPPGADCLRFRDGELRIDESELERLPMPAPSAAGT